MENIALFYTTSVIGISLVMELLYKLDDAWESWSLKDKFKIFMFETSWLKIISYIFSTGASIYITLIHQLHWLYFIGGFFAILATEYGVDKIGWRNIFKVVHWIATRKK
jgi:hypothetical protein